MLHRYRLLIPLLATAALTGCAASSTAAADGKVPVVVVENPWTDLVSAVGGDRVSVSTIISAPDADPHRYTVDVTVAQRVSAARLVVSNGLGYDSFVDKLLAASPRAGRVHLVAAAAMGVSGSESDGTNPHLWYDLARVPTMASAVADSLSKLDPAGAAGYHSRATAWTDRLQPLLDRVTALAARARALPSPPRVASTEPVAGYLVRAVGDHDVTPTAFVQAVQNESEPPASSVAALRELISSHAVRALVYNTQTGDRLTQGVAALAKDSGVPVIDVTETVPPGMSYLQWQAAHVDALATVLP